MSFTQTLRAAVVQMTPGDRKSLNLERAEYWIDQAAHAGAQLVCLPETFVYSGSHRSEHMQNVAETVPGYSSRIFSQWARHYNIYLAAGSLFETNPDDAARPFNTSLVFSPEGERLAKYRKNHLFCFQEQPESSQKALSEADYQTPGSKQDRAVAETPWGGMGLSICYDLRFPALYQYYSREMGATLLTVPSKFLKTTGEAHWLPLLQAVEDVLIGAAHGVFGVLHPLLSKEGRHVRSRSPSSVDVHLASNLSHILVVGAEAGAIGLGHHQSRSHAAKDRSLGVREAMLVNHGNIARRGRRTCFT